MLENVHYGTFTFKPWFNGSGYVDFSAKSLKSFRSREPRSIWQDLKKPDDLKQYDLYICRFCFVYSSKQSDIDIHEHICPFKTVISSAKETVKDEIQEHTESTETLSLSTEQNSNKGETEKNTPTISSESVVKHPKSEPSDDIVRDCPVSKEHTHEPCAAHVKKSEPQLNHPSPKSNPNSNMVQPNIHNLGSYGVLYEDENFQIYKVKNRFVLQCLSLFGHLFLETKSICFNLTGFEFYLVWSKKHEMYAGFFSKEQNSFMDYNLACIVIFPPFQKMGLGQLMINFSYILDEFVTSRKADDKKSRIGSPEKPLSEFGEKAYTKFWRQKLVQSLIYENVTKKRRKLELTFPEMEEIANINSEDLKFICKPIIKSKKIYIKDLVDIRKSKSKDN